ncbi:hypothetical protein [Streptomyces crystallinus]|uniref:Uncharacterized protein n=1 Tax=Streptomyces crystallinus TaxID=68191 RepID=A0ABP3Q3J8_9ACTN
MRVAERIDGREEGDATEPPAVKKPVRRARKKAVPKEADAESRDD